MRIAIFHFRNAAETGKVFNFSQNKFRTLEQPYRGSGTREQEQQSPMLLLAA